MHKGTRGMTRPSNICIYVTKNYSENTKILTIFTLAPTNFKVDSIDHKILITKFIHLFLKLLLYNLCKT